MGANRKQSQKKQNKRKSRQAKKKHQRKMGAMASAKGKNGITQALDFPIYQCLQSEKLFENGKGYLVISRKSQDKVLIAVFLLDVYCLGVKDTFIQLTSEEGYQYRIEGLKEYQQLKTIHQTCAKKLVEGSIEYARDLGFLPHKDYSKTQKIFGDIDSSLCPLSFTFGKDGKPFFVAGPDDSVTKCNQVINILTRRLGADGFHYITLLPIEDMDFDLDPTLDIKNSVDHALSLLENDQMEEAETMINNLIKKHPRHHQVQYAMGFLLIFQDKIDEAITYFDAAIEISPQFIDAHYNRAVAYKEKLEIENMVRAFQDVIRIGESHNYFVKESQKMLDSFESSIMETDGVDLETYIKSLTNFDNGFEQMENGNIESAIKLFQKSISYNGNNPKPYSNLGICYSKIGKQQLALEAFDKAIEIDPTYQPALINRKVTERM